MPREALSKRAKWQGEAGAKGRSAEDTFTVIMRCTCKPITVNLKGNLRRFVEYMASAASRAAP